MRYRMLSILAVFVLLLVHPASGDDKGTVSPSEQEFCRLDKNNDREISFEEFSECEFYKLEHVRKLPFSDPDLNVRNKAASMTDDELKAYLFQKADKNKDRKIDRKEWEEFYSSIRDVR